ncbi:MAG TPA: thioredoxin [Marinilabiliaceae bacterium]|nr:thioredoxin [Marinilabiliaceae bacterium]
MRKIFFVLFSMGFLLYASAENLVEREGAPAPLTPAAAQEAKVITLDEAAFIDKVFDFKNNQKWSYKGDRPAIIDFYADWCGPCKLLAPILAQLQSEYGSKIQVYKVDAEANRELAAAFGVTAYPTMLFIPMDAEPAGARGLLPKEELERIISTYLKVEK